MKDEGKRGNDDTLKILGPKFKFFCLKYKFILFEFNKFFLSYIYEFISLIFELKIIIHCNYEIYFI